MTILSAISLPAATGFYYRQRSLLYYFTRRWLEPVELPLWLALYAAGRLLFLFTYYSNYWMNRGAFDGQNVRYQADNIVIMSLQSPGESGMEQCDHQGTV